MSQDSQPGDYVFYGTPLQSDEAESKRAHEFQMRDVKDAATVKALPVWQQEVVDSEGRQRFHGAFTGGWSAGYYNTAGSAEGWAPSTFKSSRAERGEVKKQAVEDFLDEDELELARTTAVQAAPEFDTFGGTAAEVARRTAEADAAGRAGALPNLLPDELVAPVADSIGIRLLQAMGWRQGKGVGAGGRGTAADGGGSRWGRVAGVGPENVPLYRLEPKDNVHGLGFDPFKGAEEFRAAKRARDGVGEKLQPLPPTKRQRGVAFGSGVADEDDVYGMVEDYAGGSVVKARAAGKDGGAYHFELASDEEDDDLGPSLTRRNGKHRGAEPPRLLGRPAPLQLTDGPPGKAPGAFIAGFVPAKDVVRLPFYPPPTVPKDFVARHVFPPPPPPRPASGDRAHAPPSMSVPMSNEERFRRDMQSVLTQFAERARAAAAADPGRRSAPLSLEEDDQPLPSGGFATPVTARPGVAGSSAPTPAAAALGEAPFLAASGVLEASFVKASVQDMTADGSGQQRPQAGLRQAAGRQPAAGNAAGAQPDVPPATAAPGVIPSASAAERQRPVRTAREWRPMPLLCKRLDVMDPYRGKKAPLEVAAPKQGIAGALFDLGSTQQEQAARQRGAAAGPQESAGQQGAMPPLPPRPAQAAALASRFASSGVELPRGGLQNGQQVPTASAAVTGSHEAQRSVGRGVVQPAQPAQSAAVDDASSFLSSLELLPPPPPLAGRAPASITSAQMDATASWPLPPPPATLPTAPETREAAAQPMPAEVVPEPERPIDLFKAIFEADDDDDEPDDEEDPALALAVVKTEVAGDASTAVGGAQLMSSGSRADPAAVERSAAAMTGTGHAANEAGVPTNPSAAAAANGSALDHSPAVGPAAPVAWSAFSQANVDHRPSVPEVGLDPVAAARLAEQSAIAAALARVRKAAKKDKEKRKKHKERDKAGKKKDKKQRKAKSKKQKTADGAVLFVKEGANRDADSSEADSDASARSADP